MSLFVIQVPVPRECVRNVVQFYGKPLTVSFYFPIHQYMSVVAGGVFMDRGLKGLFTNFVEVLFLHSFFGCCCCAVGHQQDAVAAFQAAGKLVNPGGDDIRKVIE